ncbi:phage major capsid protein [Sphingomonas sp. CJ99]
MTTHTTRGLQECREIMARHGGKLKAVAGDTFDTLHAKLEKAKSNGAHVADFRRIRQEAASWIANHTDKPDWNPERDQPAYDAALAFLDICDGTISNQVAALEALKGAGRFGEAGTDSGWINARTKEPIRLLKPDEKLSADKPRPDISVGALLEGMLVGPRNHQVRNALESGTDTAGGYTVPEMLMSEFIDKLRARSVFVEAGARTMTLDEANVKIVRLEGDPTATWRTENASIGDSDALFGAISMNARSLSTLVKVPYELLQDGVNIAEILETALIGALSTELDRAAMFGAGGLEPAGLFGRSINSVSMGTDGGTPDNYDDLLDMVYEMELDNAGPATAAIWHPRTARTYRKLKDTTNQPLVAPEPVASMPKLATTAVPIDQTQGTAAGICSTVLMGNFADAILAIREQLTIIRLDQTFAANGQVGFWARMRADVAFTREASFCKLIGVKA